MECHLIFYCVGVDYTHPALGGGFGEGYKVVAGYDFVGNHWNSSDPNSKPEPKNDPLDNCGKNTKASGKGVIIMYVLLRTNHIDLRLCQIYNRSWDARLRHHCWI